MRQARRGATLVEQVVALTLLSIGLLAVAAVGDALHRGARYALRRAEVIGAAAAWRERLAAAGCVGAADGTVEEGRIRVRWRTEPLGAASILVVRAEATDTVAPGARAAAHETIGATRCAG